MTLMHLKWFLLLSVVLSCLALITGCGKSKPVTAALSGEIKTSSGAPCDGALIVLHPQEPTRVNAAKPLAIASADGKFIVRTHSENDGAEPGDYAITVVWPGKADGSKTMSLGDEGSQVGGGPDRLKNLYGDPKTTTLKVTVKADGNDPLQLTVNESP